MGVEISSFDIGHRFLQLHGVFSNNRILTCGVDKWMYRKENWHIGSIGRVWGVLVWGEERHDVWERGSVKNVCL